MPLTKLLTVVLVTPAAVVAAWVQVTPPSVEMLTTYPVIAEPLVLEGAVQLKEMDWLAVVALRLPGALGGAMAWIFVVADQAPCPTDVSAATR